MARLLGHVHLAGTQPFQQFVRRCVDQHHFISLLEHGVRHGFLHAHAGNAGNNVVQAFDMLDIDGGIDVDAGRTQLLHVLPAFGMPRCRLTLDRVAVREFVYQL